MPAKNPVSKTVAIFYSQRLHAMQPASSYAFSNDRPMQGNMINASLSKPRTYIVNIAWKKQGRKTPFGEVQAHYPDAVYKGDLTKNGLLLVQKGSGKSLLEMTQEARAPGAHINPAEDWFLANLASTIVTGKSSNANPSEHVLRLGLQLALYNSKKGAPNDEDFVSKTIETWLNDSFKLFPGEKNKKRPLSFEILPAHRQYLERSLLDAFFDNMDKLDRAGGMHFIIDDFFEVLNGRGQLSVRQQSGGAPIPFNSLINGPIPRFGAHAEVTNVKSGTPNIPTRPVLNTGNQNAGQSTKGRPSPFIVIEGGKSTLRGGPG